MSLLPQQLIVRWRTRFCQHQAWPPLLESFQRILPNLPAPGYPSSGVHRFRTFRCRAAASEFDNDLHPHIFTGRSSSIDPYQHHEAVQRPRFPQTSQQWITPLSETPGLGVSSKIFSVCSGRKLVLPIVTPIFGFQMCNGVSLLHT